MRVGVAMMVVTAVVLTGSRPAAADDASVGGSIDGAATPHESDGPEGEGAIVDTMTQPSGSGAAGEDAASGEPDVVVACDGALCDTTQGRPTCSVAAQSIGGLGMDPGGLATAAGLAALALTRCARRPRRGT
jgi:hypothetical protein